MPQKDPEVRKVYVRDYMCRKRSDPARKEHEAKVRRKRYAIIKDRLNEKRKSITAQRSKKKNPSAMTEKPDRIAIAKDRRAARADVVRQALLLRLPKDGTVHSFASLQKELKGKKLEASRYIIQEAMIGTDIKTVAGCTVVYLYRL